MVLAEAGTLELAVAIIGLITTLITTIIAIWKSIKAGNYKQAADDGGKMLDAVAVAVDKIKTGSSSNGARELVSSSLKDMGTKLEDLGLKEKMDAKIKELGLDDKS